MTTPPPPPSPPAAAVKKSNAPLIIGIVITVVVLALCIVGGLVVFGLKAVGSRVTETNSIVAVVNKHAEIQNRLNAEMKDKAAFLPAFKRAVNEFHDIDTSSCPSDFRVVYQRYLATCDALERETSTLLGVINSKPYVERMQHAWDEVEACAVGHGLTFTHSK